MAVRNNPGAGNGANIRLAADIGGTFTDIAVFDDKTGRLTFGKALSTPDRLVDGISGGVDKWAALCIGVLSMVLLSWIICSYCEPAVRRVLAAGIHRLASQRIFGRSAEQL